jgi:hypothetical protein
MAPGDEVPLVAAAAVEDPRALSADHFHASVPVPGAHVLLLDDTWAGGGHVQSASLALRTAGADHVSALVVARWLKPEFGSTAQFVGEQADRDYDPLICPWTGGTCP